MRTLRVYLAILVLGAMLPGAIVTTILVWRVYTNARAAGARRLLESARVDAAALDREFNAAMKVLAALATSPALDANDLAAFHAEGRRIQATQPGWFTIMLHSLDEQQLVSTRLDWGAPLTAVVEPQSLRRVIQTGTGTVGPVRKPQVAGPALLFPVRVPVARDGQVKYVLSAIIDVATLARIVPELPAGSDEWTRTILDSDDTIAVRTRSGADFVGRSATDAFRERIRRAPESVSADVTLEGLAVYAATSRSTFGWTTVIVVPRASLDRPLAASMVAILIGGALLMLFGVAAVLFVSRRLSSDLRTATSSAEALAAGRPIGEGEGHVVETRRLQRSLVSAATLLDQRARERDEQLQRAEQANQVKDQFLAVLGHELRNPLAPALTALELMRRRNPEASRREREILERQVAHMTRLVDDLLDVSRLSRGKTQLVLKRFELIDAVERAVDMVQPLLVQKHHALDVQVPSRGLVVDGDIDRIVQILANLLTNAAKYTPANGHISLSAAAAGDRVRIACEDDGPGVPADVVPVLFEAFAQGPRALDRREGGLGLGLALARTFTELHGGTLTFEPVPAGGSRFVLSLPVVSAAVEARPAHDSAPRTVAAPRRVLVVDDNHDAAEMLRSALAEAGHHVTAAGSGPEALHLVAEFRPEVGVLDIGLPGMTGYELAGRLREANPDIRLVALTGYGQASDVAAAARAGFDAHFAKPVPIAALLDALNASSAGDATSAHS